MRVAYFDCFSGISGDMVLGALIDAGLEPSVLEERLSSLGLEGYKLEFVRVTKQGIAGTKVNVSTEEAHAHRHLADINAILEKSELPVKVVKTAKRIFANLAKAEAKVHNTQPEKIHFHEVGAIDAIIDIVGAVIGLEELGVEEVYASPLHTGSGFVQCAHGLMPVPAPATAELLKSVPVYSKGIEHELVTPTGAAIITTLAKSFGNLPELVVEKIGYGAGERDLEIPNLLRVVIGRGKTGVDGLHTGTFTMIETNIDDMNPEFYDYLFYKLSVEGAVDVYLSSVYMKKNRPGTMLHVLAPKEKQMKLIQTIFKETTTLGVRCYEIQKISCANEHIPVETRYGTVRIKVSKNNGEIVNVAPEYEDCRLAAIKHNVPIKIVYDAAKIEIRELLK